MSFTRVAAVTGANKGIGLAIVRNIALQYPKSPMNNGPLLVYLTARNQERGEQALKNLEQDPKLQEHKALASHGGLTTVKYHALDVEDDKSIHTFADFLSQQHPSGIDIAINNAGIALDGFDAQIVKQTLACNYYGCLTASRAFLPILKSEGRLVNVSSLASRLTGYSDANAQAFRDTKTVGDVDKLMQQFYEVTAEGKNSEKGWPTAAYKVSKAGVNGMTRALAREEKEKGSHKLINCCCPGYVNTDMTKGKGRKTPDQGAEVPVFLALDDLKGVSGEFWVDKEVSHW